METLPVEGDDIPYSADIGDFVDVKEGDRWKCQLCGVCCGNVYSKTWLDITMMEYIKEPVDGNCPNLDPHTKLCRIHDTRPNVCRGYPFIIRKSGDHYKLQVHSRCIGLGHGPEVDIEAKAVELVKYCEDELGIEFMVRTEEDGSIRMYRIK